MTGSTSAAIARTATFLCLSHDVVELLPARVIAAVAERVERAGPAYAAVARELDRMTERERQEVVRFARLYGELRRWPTEAEINGSEEPRVQP